MHYKTIIHALLTRRTLLHERLRRHRQLLPAMERLSRQLKERHEFWMATLSHSDLNSDPVQISSQALELALREVEDQLPPESEGNEDETLSLDAAMAFLGKASPKE
jgi:hypothetical protein